jgi:hypothetical protein
MHDEMVSIITHMPRLVDVNLGRMGVLDRIPEIYHLPQNLGSFDLSAVEIKQDPLPVLEKLQCLVVLKLEGYSGRTMSCSASGFPRLQNLELVNFRYTEEWKIETGAMPKLSHLTLNWLASLRNLPESLLHLRFLNKVEVDNFYVGDERTLKELKQKGCKVKIPFIPPSPSCPK